MLKLIQLSFLKLILFNLVAFGKEFGTTQKFLQPEQNKILLLKHTTVLKISLKILDIVSERGFVLQFLEATVNLLLMGVSYILVNYYIIGSALLSSSILVQISDNNLYLSESFTRWKV